MWNRGEDVVHRRRRGSCWRVSSGSSGEFRGGGLSGNLKGNKRESTKRLMKIKYKESKEERINLRNNQLKKYKNQIKYDLRKNTTQKTTKGQCIHCSDKRFNRTHIVPNRGSKERRVGKILKDIERTKSSQHITG